jgi:very-short-patch-repair endonuclease
VQYLVADEFGYPLARVDLAYPAVRLAIEFDGAHHFDARRVRADRQRDAERSCHGSRTLRLVDDDVLAMPETARRVRELFARSAA